MEDLTVAFVSRRSTPDNEYKLFLDNSGTTFLVGFGGHISLGTCLVATTHVHFTAKSDSEMENKLHNLDF